MPSARRAKHRPILRWMPWAFAWLISTAAASDWDDAQELFHQGDYDACLVQTQDAIDTGVWNQRWPVLQIRSQLATGLYPEARTTLLAALSRYSWSLPLHELAIDIHRLHGDYDKAEASLEALQEQARSRASGSTSAEDLVWIGRALARGGGDAKEILDTCLRRAQRLEPDLVSAYVAIAELALEKSDSELAAEQIQRALELSPDDPDLHVLNAKAFESSDRGVFHQSLNQALALNPKHTPSLLLLARDEIDSERYPQAVELLDRVHDVDPHQWQAWALRSVLAHLHSQSEDEAKYREKALLYDSRNPRVDHLIGEALSKKYRFREGAAAQRRALKFDATFLPAKFQLAQDLLRLGDEEEGWKLADEVLQQDPYNVVAYNLMTLHDRLGDFVTLERRGLKLRMDAREASIYGASALDLIDRAARELGDKYEVTLDSPITVEIFPEQKDFAIRTFGLPGGAGYLGVCFGCLVTANSPASQGESPANWQAVLWHEMCHVITLHKTANKLPRWLSEGLSVYEERQREASWGERMNLLYRTMILEDQATPVSRLSAAFLFPKSPLHVQFAYYESSMVVEYLIERFGHDAMQRILKDLGQGVFINEALAKHTVALDELDTAFDAYLRKQVDAYGQKVDWGEWDANEASPQDMLAHIENHPFHLMARVSYGEWLLAQSRYEEASFHLGRATELCPKAIGDGSPWDLLARAHRGLDQTDAERDALNEWFLRDDNALKAGLRIMEIDEAKSDWDSLKSTASKVLAIQPLIPEPHRHLARAALETGDSRQIIDAYGALLALEDLDPAEAHYRLATAHWELGNREQALRQVLSSLEVAPRYREALELLLTITRSDDSHPVPEDAP